MPQPGIELIGLIVIAGGMVFTPGLFLLAGLGRASSLERISVASIAANALALSFTLLACLWMGATLVGARWTPLAISVVMVALGGASCVVWGRRLRSFRLDRARRDWHALLPGLSLLLVLLIGIALRLWVARDLAYPAWVDSPHHDVIVRLLALHGRVPDTYEPVLPVGPFTYHFGFHVAALVYHWLTGLPSSDAMLILGQVLNGLMPLAVYAFVVQISERRWTAVGAAAIVGLVSLFPAYYVSWGRTTQLAGLLILVPLLGHLAQSRPMRPGQRSEAWSWGRILLVGALAAGVLYTHYRVVVFGAMFGLALALVDRKVDWRLWLPAAGVALLLTAPWLLRLVEAWVAPNLVDPSAYLAPAGYNSFPWHYFNSTLERAWWGMAALGAVIGVFRRERAILVIVVWVALTSALLNIPGAGSWVVNNNSWAISAFLPGSVAAGYGLEQIGRLSLWLWRSAPQAPARPGRRTRQMIGLAVAVALAAIVIAGLGFGIQAQSRTLNPRTVLALPADREAMPWLRDNLPADALIVVNSWYWQHDIWSASDGGIWIWTETGRHTTTPPVDYYYDPVWTQAINDWNARWAKIEDFGSPEAIALLREVGATHVYLGAVPGRMTPAALAAAPEIYELLYDRDGVFIYQIEP